MIWIRFWELLCWDGNQTKTLYRITQHDAFLLNTLGLAVHKLFTPSEKNDADKWYATQAPLFSLLGHWRNDGLSKRLWSGQTNDRSQIKTIQRTLRHLKLQLAQAFNGVGSSVWTDTISTRDLGVWFEYPVSASPETSHCNGYFYCCSPLFASAVLRRTELWAER
jgi:hypothetical protein